MSIKTALVAFLKADTGVTALVGTRIFPQKRDQRTGTLPALTYRRMGCQRPGALAQKGGLAYARFELICIATTEAACDSLEAAIRDAQGGAKGTERREASKTLHGFRGTMDDVEVQACWIEDAYDGFSPDILASDEGVYVTTLVLAITYKE